MSDSMKAVKYALFGANGAVGRALAPLLAARQEVFRVVGRCEAELKRTFQQYEPFVDYCVADLSVPSDAQRAVINAETIFYLVGVPYHQFELHPLISQICIDAATQAGVKRFVQLGTLYSYGMMQGDRITEAHPRTPHTKKGRLRKQQEDIVLNAHAVNGLQVTILCAPDFYGGDSPLSLVHRVFVGAVNNTVADVIGPIDRPHEFVYVPDLARTLLQLSEKDEAYGKRWNLGGVDVITVREVANRAYGHFGRAPKLRVAGKFILRLLGIRDAILREFVEMHYLMSKPLFVDDSNLRSLLPELTKTSYNDGITTTLEFLSARSRQPLDTVQLPPARHANL